MYSKASRMDKVILVISGILGVLMVLFIRNSDTSVRIFVGVTWLEATFFIIRYGFWSNWRGTAGGRALFVYVSAFWALMTWIGISIFTNGTWPPHREDVRETLYAVFAVALFNLNLTMLRIQSHYPDEVKFRNPLRLKRNADTSVSNDENPTD